MNSRLLYLARHGALVSDEERRFVGQLDVPLSDLGIAQAHALRRTLRDAHLSRIYCSDLSRCCETAKIIAAERRMPVCEFRDLREIALGRWEGCAFADIAGRYPREFAARGADLEHYCPPGGESFADCRVRVLAAVQHILTSSDGDILLVAHAGVNRIILCEALGISLAHLFRIGQDYGCLNIVHCGTSLDRIRLLNFTPGRVVSGGQVADEHLMVVSL